jgi:TolB-like protein/Flp pilus assembly protein TadD
MPLQPGTRLGPYEIVSPLGAGGMGEVYRARDPRLGRDVAIKTLPEALAASPEALGRFEREARAVAALTHPSILAIHDVGSDRGISYAVTELLEGQDLRARLARGPLPWRRAAEIAAAVADGLAAAHTRGIVHRDLKPENLFLTADGRVKVLDFGLARQAPAVGGTDTHSPTVSRHTHPGTVLGTAGYMSPEQLRGATVDGRSDIFSLGCVLYELVSGNRPFEKPTGAETIAAILKDDPPDLSASGREVSPDLQRIIHHCLEKDADSRFQSARDLAFDLRSISGGLATAGAADTGRIDSLAVLPFANASGDPAAEDLTDGVTESLIYGLSQVPRLRVMARSTMFRFKGRDADPQAVGRELNVRAVVTGRVSQRGDTLLVQTELVDAANGWLLWAERYNRKVEDVFAVHEAIAREIAEKLQVRLTGEEQKRLTKRQTDDPAAYQLYLKGRFYWNKRNADATRKGIEYFRQAIEQDPGYALAYVGLADSYNILGFYSVVAPRDANPKAKAAARRALELDDGLAEAHASLGYALHYYDWDWAGAERAFRKAIELNPNYPTAHHWYAIYLAERGRFQEADEEIRRALEADPLSLVINTAVAWNHYFERRFAESVAEFQKALELDPSFVVAHVWLAQTLQQLSRHDEAVEECRKALALAPLDPFAIGALGVVVAAAGRREEAGSILERLAELARRRYVSPYYFAEIHLALGEIDETFAWLERSFADRATPLVLLAVDPRLDPIRSDPRFAELMCRVGA